MIRMKTTRDKWRMSLRARILASAIVVAAFCGSSGCSALYLIFGPGGLFPPDGGTGGGGGIVTPDPSTGGTSNPGNTVPTTSAPASIPGPSYRISRLDNLLEATAGGNMIISRDLDNDGRPDFASIASESQVVQIFMRNAATNLYDQMTIAGGAPLTRMVRIGAADFDGDGHTDFAVAVENTGFAPAPGSGASKVGQVVLIFSPADPRDQLSWLTVPLPNALRQNDDISIVDMAIADFDGVNGPDIAFLSNEPPGGGTTPKRFIFMFLNPGAASARSGAAWGNTRPSPLGVQPPFIEVDAPDANQIWATDVDGDGDPDLIASLSPAESFNIRWLENPGGAAIDPNPALAMPRWVRRFVGQQDLGANVIGVGDIDGDGTPDVAAATNLGGLVQWFRHPGFATVKLQNFPWSVYNVGILPDTPVTQVQVVDVNDDGKQDIWTGAGGRMSGFYPRSGADFLDWWQPFTLASTNPVATIGWPAFVDIDANGRTDFIVPLDREGLFNDQFAIFAR